MTNGGIEVLLFTFLHLFTLFFLICPDVRTHRYTFLYLVLERKKGVDTPKTCYFSKSLSYMIVIKCNKHQIHSVFPPVSKHSPKTLVECSRTLILGSQNSGDLSTIVYIIIIIYHVCDIIVGQGLPDYLTSRDLERC